MAEELNDGAPATSIIIPNSLSNDSTEIPVTKSSESGAPSSALHIRNVSTDNISGTCSGVSEGTNHRVNRDVIRGKSERTPLPKLNDVHRILLPDNEFTSVDAVQLQRIRDIHGQFSEGSKFSFNFNTLLIVASFLAAFGLANNSSTTIIASMLVSPIMGPVVGMAYGATIRDWRLCWRALRTEIVSLIVCILTGGLVALCVGPTAMANAWPNQEMLIRGNMANFYVGLPVAFVSGLGVAVGLLDDQTSSLVGVAISASLLPPAVNAGMLWIAHIYKEFDVLGQDERCDVVDCDFEMSPPPALAPTESPTTAFESLEKSDYWKFGLISLGLTVANILLIIISSILMFRMKERLPIKKKIFWDDLGIARKIYRNLAVMDVELDHAKDSHFDQILNELDEEEEACEVTHSAEQNQ